VVSKSNDVEKYIGSMLNNFRKKNHKKDVEDYLLIRKRIDKVKNYTMRNDVQSLLALDRYIEKDFKKITQDDMLKFEEFLEKDYILKGKAFHKKNKKGFSKSSIEQYMAHIKRFYKYLYNKSEYKKGKKFQKNIPYPDVVSWISSDTNNYKKLPLDKLISEEDLLKLLDICDNFRDKAMYSAGFYDAGLRIGELISLNVGNVGFDKLGGYFILPKEGVDLKTGQRKIRLFLMPSSTQYLKDFLNNHPFKKYLNAPLFYSLDMRNYLKVVNKAKNNNIEQSDFEKIRLSRPGIEGNLRKLCKYAGIQNLTPHMLRHTSATICSKKGFNEMELRIRYGWSPTSKMPSRYVHLASKDIDDKIKIITGYKEPEEIEPSKLTNIICWNCNNENVPTNKFCGVCGVDLKPKEEITIEEKTDENIYQKLKDILEYQKHLEEKIEKLEKQKVNQ